VHIKNEKEQALQPNFLIRHLQAIQIFLLEDLSSNYMLNENLLILLKLMNQLDAIFQYLLFINPKHKTQEENKKQIFHHENNQPHQ
jgi:hypothetical protein